MFNPSEWLLSESAITLRNRESNVVGFWSLSAGTTTQSNKDADPLYAVRAVEPLQNHAGQQCKLRLSGSCPVTAGQADKLTS